MLDKYNSQDIADIACEPVLGYLSGDEHETKQETRCGMGHCRYCNCQNFKAQSQNDQMCTCLHGYGDHDD